MDRSCIARISGAAGIYGAGFLTTGRLLLTCAHVVNAALGRHAYYGAAPAEADTVVAQFPWSKQPERTYSAHVINWFPLPPVRSVGERCVDIAVLQLSDAPPTGAATAPLHVSQDTDIRIRSAGFPAGYPTGRDAEGRLAGTDSGGFLQVISSQSEMDFRPGLSGAPAFDADDRVIGMVSMVEQSRRDVALIIPAASIRQALAGRGADPSASAKNIILFLDGTWNDIEFGDSDTNILRLADLVGRSIAARLSGSLDERSNVLLYQRGIQRGREAFDLFKRSALGVGIHDGIRRAYRLLSEHYQPGDAIFVFGCSRGAYVARALVSYIESAGLLRREHCVPQLEERTWTHYRAQPNDRWSGEWLELGKFVHDRADFRVACLAVFDTVGALGIPTSPLRGFNRYALHDNYPPTITDVNLQALAIDEQRPSFESCAWRKPRFRQFQTVVEQVWFPGVHADIVGGYVEEPRVTPELDDVSLDWMIKRIRHYFPAFPLDSGRFRAIGEETAHARAHNSRRGIYRLFRRAHRSIGNIIFTTPTRMRALVVGADRHAEPIGEMVHVSALTRFGERVGGAVVKYAPLNLRVAMTAMKQVYALYDAAGIGRRSDRLRIVDWDGHVLDPEYPPDYIAADVILNEATNRYGVLPAK